MSDSTRPAQQELEAASVAEMEGKYLTFQLADEEYGFGILKVVEIIKMMAITTVPRTPGFVRGVINLRGKVIPVIELRTRFGMEGIDDTDETCIIVVNTHTAAGAAQMGILVDTVSEVMDIPAEAIEPPPTFGAHVDTAFILGMAKAKEQVIILLDIDRVLSAEELSALSELG